MANELDNKDICITVCVAAVFITATFVIGMIFNELANLADRQDFEREAISNGAATYVIEGDEEVFRWLTNEDGDGEK